jgi:hypothetical protein
MTKYVLESAVGSRGRTSAVDAEAFIKEKPELIMAFNKLVKKMGGKAVAMSILKSTKLNYSGPIIGNNGEGK